MEINGHFDDGDVVMLASIVVMVMKGGTCTRAWPDFWGYPLPPLPKDLVVERPPRTYNAASSYMALA
jgi:hypothetical protein